MDFCTQHKNLENLKIIQIVVTISCALLFVSFMQSILLLLVSMSWFAPSHGHLQKNTVQERRLLLNGLTIIEVLHISTSTHSGWDTTHPLHSVYDPESAYAILHTQDQGVVRLPGKDPILWRVTTRGSSLNELVMQITWLTPVYYAALQQTNHEARSLQLPTPIEAMMVCMMTVLMLVMILLLRESRLSRVRQTWVHIQEAEHPVLWLHPFPMCEEITANNSRINLCWTRANPPSCTLVWYLNKCLHVSNQSLVVEHISVECFDGEMESNSKCRIYQVEKFYYTGLQPTEHKAQTLTHKDFQVSAVWVHGLQAGSNDLRHHVKSI